MKAPTESDIVKACLQYLQQVRGYLAWRQNSGAFAGEYKGRKRFVRFHTAKGCSDILFVLPPLGTLCAVEVKRSGQKPTADQEAFLAAVRRAGGRAVCVTSVTELIAALP